MTVKADGSYSYRPALKGSCKYADTVAIVVSDIGPM
jgi:hypothetical protein